MVEKLQSGCEEYLFPNIKIKYDQEFNRDPLIHTNSSIYLELFLLNRTYQIDNFNPNQLTD